MSTSITKEILDHWATDTSGPVALHLKQRLVSVEGEEAIVFPPTYADIGYNIDTFSDGTRVATIDSVGSQANRLEPLFKGEFAELVPQITIALAQKGGEPLSLFDLAHRAADAVVQSSPGLTELVAHAFDALHRTGDAGPLCQIAPTSLVFGVWDSRGGSGEKRPRLLRSVIRAWDVETIHAAAQFNSVSKHLDDSTRSALEAEAKEKKVELSVKGFADAPATFRKVGQGASRHLTEFRDGAPNPERRVLGGVLVRGKIERDVTVNLVALRGVRGSDQATTFAIRRYLLGLSLLAATAEIDLFLREGCHLRYAEDDHWCAVPRRGALEPHDLSSASARAVIAAFTRDASAYFMPHWPDQREYSFDLKQAKKLLAKKDSVPSDKS